LHEGANDFDEFFISDITPQLRALILSLTHEGTESLDFGMAAFDVDTARSLKEPGALVGGMNAHEIIDCLGYQARVYDKF
jgi:hypothetical protein